MRKFFKSSLLIAGLCVFIGAIHGQTWSMKRAKIMTAFAATIDTANVLGEHPRPQMARNQWLNLNGIWQFQPAATLTEALPSGKLSSKILVPFPVESAISGIMTHYDKMWYRRTFNVPAAWAGQRVLIHFDAVDYQTEVFINNTSLGIHKGGYDAFTYDITSYLAANGPQEVTVRVFDPTDAGGQPRGKQTLYPGGIMYTPSSGIWQPVWLEAVPQTAISDIKMIPNIDNSTLKFKATTSGTATALTVTVDVYDGTTKVTSFTGNANTDLTIPVPSPKLWSPDSPFLYDMKVKLNSGTTAIDSLNSYFGMRKISMGQVGNYKKMMLNNDFLFQFGPLDQGFWPDGLYTPPTDLAIKNDLTKTKQLGFNMIRKHIKVEPYRWYYWADKLGILVWQDMPSPNSYTGTHPDIDTLAYKSELETMVKTHWNSPCIVTWVVFNESQGQHDTQALVSMVRTLDPNRLINQASGGWYYDAGNILDWHSYPPPACPTSSTQILACGEFGGIGLTVADHIWNNGTTYVMVNNTAELSTMYNSFADMLVQFKTNNGMSAAVYTELTDVETELNGLLTYDRAMVKGSISKFYSINQKVINKNLYLTDVLPTSQVSGKTWKYTTTQPAAEWYTSTFSDAGWQTGNGGFGTAGTPGGTIRTTWNTTDIWMRQTFTMGNVTASQMDSLVLKIHHDEDCEVYLNGILASTLTGYTSSYMVYPISDLAKGALIPNGVNTISVHCHQTAGGQYIDAGIALSSMEKQPVISAIQNPTVENSFKIYPNPAKNILRISRRNPQTELIGVYNVTGNKVMKLNKMDSQVNISSLQPGVYFIKTETDHQVATASFVKK
ncbi:MAG TPA: sugar-binding domain-containing protein [Paludibacter sp.]